MEMGHDEKSIVHLKIDRDRGQHNAAQPPEDKQCDETAGKKQWGFELRFGAPPECTNPAENLNSGRDRYDHAGGGEKALAELRHRRRKHVVDPEPESDERG